MILHLNNKILIIHLKVKKILLKNQIPTFHIHLVVIPNKVTNQIYILNNKIMMS
jgi:hypothetical protein